MISLTILPACCHHLLVVQPLEVAIIIFSAQALDIITIHVVIILLESTSTSFSLVSDIISNIFARKALIISIAILTIMITWMAGH